MGQHLLQFESECLYRPYIVWHNKCYKYIVQFFAIRIDYIE